ncbi:MAG TPA: DNA topoisomerase IB [Blastocatellia bacterium]|nr:DNA topoisomerase IB [Blastocatellia bacterium]
MTRIEKLQQRGILRLGRKKRFRYAGADGTQVSRNDLARIEALKIPPGWNEVAISRAASGMLQAVGKDAAGRWQYIYHERHIRNRERKKFKRLVRFAEAVPRMRRVVSRDLRRRDLGRERVMACILRILATCFMRPGSQVYANENGSYGLATLRPKHVNVRGDTIEFNFPGKSKVAQRRELKDRPVARVVSELLKHRAPEVFKYQNGDGQVTDVKRRDINAYIKEVMGDRFTAKDFRTWAGTLICACALAREGAEVQESSTSRKKKLVSAVKETAKVLGNTPTVCRSSYICPEVLRSFEHGEVIEQYFDSVGDLVNHRGMKPHKAERALVRLLKRRSK